MSAHYIIICDHVFTSLEVFLGGRGGQCRWYLQRMFSKDSERRKKGIKGVSFRYILDFFSRVYLEFPCESALWPSDGDLLKQNSASLTRCACQSRLSLFLLPQCRYSNVQNRSVFECLRSVSCGHLHIVKLVGRVWPTHTVSKTHLTCFWCGCSTLYWLFWIITTSCIQPKHCSPQDVCRCFYSMIKKHITYYLQLPYSAWSFSPECGFAFP